MTAYPCKDYNDFQNKRTIENAIIYFGKNDQNTKDQYNYWMNELKTKLSIVGFPTVFTRKPKKEKSIKSNFLSLVFLWNEGESTIDCFGGLAENCVKWFDQYTKNYLNS